MSVNNRPVGDVGTGDNICDMRPVIFRIPLPFELFGADHIPIKSFGLMVVLGLLAGQWMAQRLARRVGMKDVIIQNMFLVFIISSMLGARLFYVAINWPYYSKNLGSILAVHQGGMVYYGSFIGVTIGLLLFIRFSRIAANQLLDIVCVGAPLGMFLGRIGCLLVGDDYGKKVSEGFPLAIKFPTRFAEGDLFGIAISRDNGNLAGSMQGEWLHPAQIYMSLNALALFFLMRWLWMRRKFDGQVAASFCIVYPVTRSIIECFRGDDVERGMLGAMSTSQFVSIFVFGAGIAYYVIARRRGIGQPTPSTG